MRRCSVQRSEIISAPPPFQHLGNVVDCDNPLLGLHHLLSLGSHGDEMLNERHVQTERSELGHLPLPAGSLEPVPECQKTSHSSPNYSTKPELPRPLFRLACIHDPDS